jgi:hypothetical protein
MAKKPSNATVSSKIILLAASNIHSNFETLFIFNELRCLGVRGSDTAALTARRSTGHFTRKFAKNPRNNP